MNKIYELLTKLITYRWNYAIELLVFVAIVIFILTA